MKVLVVGPSPTKSKGGMATVIEEIAKDKRLNGKFDIEQVNKKDLDVLDLDSSENTPIKEYGILNKIKKYTKK